MGMAAQYMVVSSSLFQVMWFMATTAFGWFVLMAQLMSSASSPSSASVNGSL